MKDVRPPTPMRMLARAARLRCPNCGGAGIFSSWLRMRTMCHGCGLRLDRGESDHWLGAYTVNLVAAELVAAGFLLAVLVLSLPDVPWRFLQWGGVALMVGAPFAFFPFSRTVWLAADLIFRPVGERDLVPPAGGGPGRR